VIDAAGDALHLLADRSPFALPAFFTLGAFTAIGPCVAPRYVALAALIQRTRRPWRIAAAFASGVVSAYVAIGMGAGLLGTMRAWSTAIDVGMALALALAGGITLLRDEGVHAHAARNTTSGGGAFLLGATSALVVSPCCTPIVAAIAGFAGFDGQPLAAALLLTAFAAGHALPLGAVALGARSMHALSRLGSTSAGSVVAGTLMIALAGFYALRA
jgi:thiol:disulfide interchange protein DsbD